MYQDYRAVKASATENVYMRATTEYFCLLEFDTWIHCDFGFTELPNCPLELTDVLNFLAQEHLLEIKPDLDLTLSKYWLNCDLKQTSNTLHSQGHLFAYTLGLFIQIIFHSCSILCHNFKTSAQHWTFSRKEHHRAQTFSVPHRNAA